MKIDLIYLKCGVFGGEIIRNYLKYGEITVKCGGGGGKSSEFGDLGLHFIKLVDIWGNFTCCWTGKVVIASFGQKKW